MRRLIIVFLCLININSYATERLDTTISGRTFSFSTATIPERASVRVYCEFDMKKDYDTGEFYAYVTPYAKNFHVMAYIDESYTSDSQEILEEIGSKVYMLARKSTRLRKKRISIVGVTQNNEAIIIDLSHTPLATTVNCIY